MKTSILATVALATIAVVGGGLYLAFFVPTQSTERMMDQEEVKEEVLMKEEEKMEGEIMMEEEVMEEEVMEEEVMEEEVMEEEMMEEEMDKMMEEAMVMTSDLRQAGGSLEDTTNAGDWVVSGFWNLDCGPEACNSGPLENIIFEMEHTMIRSNGIGAHSHTYSGFTATSAIASGDELTIEGNIMGSGPVGNNAIVIRVDLKSGLFTFQLPGNSHLQGEIGGTVSDFQ